MLPYIEQSPLYNAFNVVLGSEGPLISSPPPGFTANSTVATTMIASFQCPSDSPQRFGTSTLAVFGLTGLTWTLSKGNYAVNWGNTDFGQAVTGTTSLFNANPSLHLQTPFGINASATGPSLVRIASITDGTSNTAAASEILQGAQDDVRGTLWISLAGGSCYMTRFTPNSYQDYVPLFLPWSAAGIASAGAKTDLLLTGLCDSQPVQQLACTNLAVEGGDFVGSRSRHPGGVNTVFWRRLGPLPQEFDQPLDLGPARIDRPAAR